MAIDERDDAELKWRGLGEGVEGYFNTSLNHGVFSVYTVKVCDLYPSLKLVSL